MKTNTKKFPRHPSLTSFFLKLNCDNLKATKVIKQIRSQLNSKLSLKFKQLRADYFSLRSQFSFVFLHFLHLRPFFY